MLIYYLGSTFLHGDKMLSKIYPVLVGTRSARLFKGVNKILVSFRVVFDVAPEVYVLIANSILITPAYLPFDGIGSIWGTR